jgi:hypothetical protein
MAKKNETGKVNEMLGISNDGQPAVKVTDLPIEQQVKVRKIKQGIKDGTYDIDGIFQHVIPNVADSVEGDDNTE